MPAYEDFAALEQEGWTRADTAQGYVDLFAPASDMAIPAIRDALRDPGPVLDLCCGQGNVTEALLRDGHQVTSVDFSAAMLGHARRRVPGGNFVEADAQDLPFPDGTFGTVVCSFGLMHVPDQPRALAEIGRVLAPGGRFVMTCWAGPDVSPVFRLFYGSMRDHGAAGVSLPDSPDFHQFADAVTAHGLLEEAGLALESSQPVDCHWWLEQADDLFEIFRQGAPRAGYLLRQQPPEALSALRAAIAAGARESFADGAGLRVPMPAVMVIASRP